jgi:tetratricopeptide (TPR) repeat protein
MHPLTLAVHAELDADYRVAIACYLRLSRQGSTLDRVGIYQAIARCFEKSGSNRRAAYWHERAGQGYMKLPARVMGRQERAYYAAVEFHAAIQDYAPKLARHGEVQSYLRALGVCLEAGKEGYSHEMLFAAHLCAKIHVFRQAAVFFTDCAVRFQKEGQSVLARECYRLGAQCYERSRKPKLAEKLRALALY